MNARIWGILVFGGIAATIAPQSAAADGAPEIIDTIGTGETDIRAHVYPTRPATWAPHLQFYVHFEAHAPENAVMVQWLKGRKKLGKPFACNAKAWVDTVQENPTTEKLPVHVAFFDCRFPKELAIKGGGNYSLKLTYNQLLEKKKHDLGSFDLKVDTLKQGSQNNQSDSYVENRDHTLGVAFIGEAAEESGRGAEGEISSAYYQHHDLRYKSSGDSIHTVIQFWTKYDKSGPRRLEMACLRDGKRVAQATYAGGDRHSYWTFKGKKNRESADWIRHKFNFYGLRVKKSAESKETGREWYYLHENPGDYRCVATGSGKIIKELFFTVGADGNIVPTACQEQIRSPRHIYVARAKDGDIATVKYDKRAGKKSAFFGRVKWKGKCPPK